MLKKYRLFIFPKSSSSSNKHIFVLTINAELVVVLVFMKKSLILLYPNLKFWRDSDIFMIVNFT